VSCLLLPMLLELELVDITARRIEVQSQQKHQTARSHTSCADRDLGLVLKMKKLTEFKVLSCDVATLSHGSQLETAWKSVEEEEE